MESVFDLCPGISEFKEKRSKKTGKKIKYFGRKRKASYVMAETLLVPKLGSILDLLSKGELFSFLFSVLRNFSKLEKDTFSFFSSKETKNKKSFDVAFRLI